MSKSDDLLLELNRGVAVYLKRIPPFKYQNKEYRLIDNYIATPIMRCDICGDYPQWEISIIESCDGHTIRVGNACIDRLTGQNVSEWMKNFRQKRVNILANRRCIDQLSRILDAQNRKESSLEIPKAYVKEFRAILNQLCKGLNLTTKQRQLTDSYLTLQIRA